MKITKVKKKTKKMERRYRIVVIRTVAQEGRERVESEMDIRAISIDHALGIVGRQMRPMGKFHVSQVWMWMSHSKYWKLVPWRVWKSRQCRKYANYKICRHYSDELEEEVMLALKPIAEKYRKLMKKGQRRVGYHCTRAMTRMFPWGGRNA